MKTTSPLLQSPLLRQYAPYTVSGYALFRDIIDTDGALPARIKALFVAVAAVAKGRGELAQREVRRGVSLGLELKEAVGGLIVLSSLRGEGAALSFQAILEAEYSGQPDTQPGMPSETVAPGEAADNFTQYFGTIPAPLAILLRLVPKAADAYYLMRKGSIDCNPLSRKYGELLLLTILAADYSPMALTHVRGARTAGATDAEMAETILCAIPPAGVAAWMGAAAFLETA